MAATSLHHRRSVDASNGARLELWRTDPRNESPLAPAGQEGVLLGALTFSLMNSGNRTKHASKRSWKVNFEVGGNKDRFIEMSRLNLKSMYNDPSQMREALAWNLFAKAGVPAPRSTYAKLMINDRYMGLFFFIEQIDRRFLKDYFGAYDGATCTRPIAETSAAQPLNIEWALTAMTAGVNIRLPVQMMRLIG